MSIPAPTMFCTAFAGDARIGAGPLPEVALLVRARLAAEPTARVLTFDDASGRPVDLDLRGTEAEILARLRPAEPVAAEADSAPRGPGRPKLGVVSREITLLPRHWDWLNAQPGGASVALRKLVEEARRANEGADRIRHAQEATYRFMTAMAGNQPQFEEAIRALFAGDRDAFSGQIAAWPLDVRAYTEQLAGGAFAAGTDNKDTVR